MQIYDQSDVDGGEENPGVLFSVEARAKTVPTYDANGFRVEPRVVFAHGLGVYNRDHLTPIEAIQLGQALIATAQEIQAKSMTREESAREAFARG